MSDKKITDVMFDRIKHFINALENGEYEPNGYTFTIELNYQGNKTLSINDSYLKN